MSVIVKYQDNVHCYLHPTGKYLDTSIDKPAKSAKKSKNKCNYITNSPWNRNNKALHIWGDETDHYDILITTIDALKNIDKCTDSGVISKSLLKKYYVIIVDPDQWYKFDIIFVANEILWPVSGVLSGAAHLDRVFEDGKCNATLEKYRCGSDDSDWDSDSDNYVEDYIGFCPENNDYNCTMNVIVLGCYGAEMIECCTDEYKHNKYIFLECKYISEIIPTAYYNNCNVINPAITEPPFKISKTFLLEESECVARKLCFPSRYDDYVDGKYQIKKSGKYTFENIFDACMQIDDPTINVKLTNNCHIEIKNTNIDSLHLKIKNHVYKFSMTESAFDKLIIDIHTAPHHSSIFANTNAIKVTGLLVINMIDHSGFIDEKLMHKFILDPKCKLEIINCPFYPCKLIVGELIIKFRVESW